MKFVTSALKEPSHLVELILWQRRQDLLSSIHIASQHRSLVLDNVERKGVSREVEVFICEVYAVVCGDVAKEEEWPIVDGIRQRKEKESIKGSHTCRMD
jgi:hypothetical protein